MATITLPAISNPTPPTVGSFDRYWVTQMVITDRVFTAQLAAYDGTNMLVGHDKRITVANTAANSTLNGLVSTARSVIQTLAAKTTLPDVISVSASAPAQPIRATSIWNPAVKTTPPTQPFIYPIADLLGLAGTNTDVANSIGALLTWVATQP